MTNYADMTEAEKAAERARVDALSSDTLPFSTEPRDGYAREIDTTDAGNSGGVHPLIAAHHAALDYLLRKLPVNDPIRANLIEQHNAANGIVVEAPRLPNETDAQYNARVQPAQRIGAATAPRLPNETDAQYNARVNPSQRVNAVPLTGRALGGTPFVRSAALPGDAAPAPVPGETVEQYNARVFAAREGK